MAKKLLESVENKIARVIERFDKGQGNAGGGGKPDAGNDATFQQQVLASLSKLHEKVDGLTMKIADVNTLLDKVNAATNNIAAKVTAEQAEIAALKGQIAAGTPVTQEQLDGIGSRLGTVSTQLEAIAADPADPLPADVAPVDNPPVAGTVG